ncbi:MAG TPA: hypothetical protein VES89_14040, partial [Candidatus Competibacteraceae bacterium]|nr:hypothetical protein [Candidatus Competibacteraceae bacterium]
MLISRIRKSNSAPWENNGSSDPRPSSTTCPRVESSEFHRLLIADPGRRLQHGRHRQQRRWDRRLTRTGLPVHPGQFRLTRRLQQVRAN